MDKDQIMNDVCDDIVCSNILPKIEFSEADAAYTHLIPKNGSSLQIYALIKGVTYDDKKEFLLSGKS